MDTMNRAPTANVPTWPRTSRSRDRANGQPDRGGRRRADEDHGTDDAQDGHHRMEPVLWAVDQGRDREYRDRQPPERGTAGASGPPAPRPGTPR